MRILKFTLAFLTANILGCSKAPPAVPPTTAAPTSAPAAPAGPDRAAARAANTAGMKLYKEKNFAAAAEQFRAAIAADSGFVLARYNLACVAALTKDKDTARAQLEFLSQSPDAYARAKLAKARGDSDLQSLQFDEKVGPLLRWGDMFLGYRPLAFVAKATTQAQAAALAKAGTASGCEADQGTKVHAITAELFAETPGQETLLVSLEHGLVVQGSDGKVLAKGAAPTCEGLQDSILDASIGQVVSDPEPEIVIHYTTGGRVGVEHMLIFKRKGKELGNILDVTLYDPGRKWKAEESWEALAESGKLLLSPDGIVRYRSEDEKTNETRKWDAAKFEFVAASTDKKPVAPLPKG
jgi:hypothetical protein